MRIRFWLCLPEHKQVILAQRFWKPRQRREIARENKMIARLHADRS